MEDEPDYIAALAGISRTPQHEEIEKMLTFYGVQGVINLTPEQIKEYTLKVLKEKSNE